MSIIPQQLCLSDEEDEQEMLDEKEPELFSTDIRKNLVDEFTAKTPMKLTRQSINHKREHMKVFLRIRPFTGEEISNGEEQDCMHISKETTLTMRAPKDSFAFKSSMRGCQEMTHNFTFTGIYGPETSQKSFFDDTMLSSVKSVIDGQNCLVFTYGVTNAGKTYTIQGLPQDGGILPRTLDVIFNSIDGRHYDSMQLKPQYFCDVLKLTEKQMQAEEAVKSSVLAIANSSPQQGIEPDSLEASDIESSKLSNNSTVYEDSLMTSDTSTVNDADATQCLINDIRSRIPDDTSVDVEAQGPIKFSIWVSFAEIYNEYIYDLLEAVPKGKKVRRQALKLSEDKHGSIFIKGLKEIQVSNADEAYKVLKIGQKNLSIAATKLNHNSSRSHCIFSIKILRVVDVADPHIARVSKISFCDLAGSERSTKTQSEGDRLKEAGNINTSLLTLGKCIHALRYNQNHSNTHPKVIPFRESKLTRLFQSFFLGKGLASMVVNVNQCASMFDETMHVLKFSAIAKQVTTVTSKLDNKWQMPKVKNKLISARALSLVVDKSLSSNTSRTSIPWATPRTMAREVQRASDLTRIDESMIEEEDEDDEEEDELEETLNDDGTPVDEGGVAGASRVALIGLVDVLKNELVEAKKQLQTMETQIRAEVCEEMAKQLVEIEASYNERLQEEKEMVEEVYEKKMEILTKSVKKTHSKKPRTQQDDEDFVPAMVHASLQAKVEEKEERIAELTKELERRATEISKLEKSKDDESRNRMESVARDDTNKLQEQIEMAERKIEELVAEKMAMEKEVTVEKDKGKELLEELENIKSESARQLDNMKQTSRTKLEEVLSEREKLTNSHQELVQQIAVLQTDADSKHQSLLEQVQTLSEEKEKLKNFISDLEEQLTSVTTAASEEKQVLEEKYEDVMKERNKLAETLESQQKQLNLFQEESNSEKQTSDDKFQEAIKEKNQLKESLDLLEKHVEKMEKEHQNERTTSEEKFQEAIKERNQLEEYLSVLEKQMETMKKEHENERKTSDEKFQEAIKERNQLVESLNLLEKQIEAMKKEHENERKTSDDNFQEAIKERNQLVASLNVLEKQMESMKKEHDNEKMELLSKFEELEKENADLKCQSEKQTESMEEMTSQNLDKLESLKSQVSSLEEENKQLKGKNQTLEESLAGFKKEAGELIEDTNQKLSKDTEQFQKTEAELKERLSTASKTTEELKAEMEKTLDENKQLKSKLEAQAEKEKQHDSQRFEELEVYKNRVASLVVENEQLLSHKKDLELSSEELRRQLDKGREECKNIMEENKKLSENLQELEKKTVDLTTQAIELTSKKMQETEESTKVRLENRKLNAKVPILERQVNDLLDEIAPLRKKNNELTAKNAELDQTLKRENSMRDDLFKQQTDMAEEIADLKQQIDALTEKKEEAAAKVVTLEEEMEKVKGQLVEERENIEKLKATKEELKVEKKVEKRSQQLQDVLETREENNEEESDEVDEEENCEAYTLDDLEDGLEGGDEVVDQKIDTKTEESDEQKDLSRISFAEPASTDTSRVEVDATPLMKRKKGRGAKAKKRKSVDVLDDEPDMVVSKKKKKPSKEEVAPRRQTRGMSRARRAKTVPVHFEEQENIPEERPSPGAVSTASMDSSNKRGAFSKLGDMLQNSPLGRSAKRLVNNTTSPAAKSPPKVVEIQTEGKRRKRKLFKTDISAPFECSPFETVKIGDASTIETGQRVTRSLRSRTKKTSN